MSNEAEDVMDKVDSKQHKGNYGQTNGKSANALYKNYKTFVTDQGKSPMPFPEWLKWAKEKKVIPGENYGADAVKEEGKKDDANVPVKSNMKKYASVVFIGLAALVLYKAWKSEDTK